MAIRPFDNIYVPLEPDDQKKVLAIRKFFEEMELPNEAIERRIALAYDLESTFWLLLSMIRTMQDEGEEITEEYLDYFLSYGQNGYREALDKHGFYKDTDYTNNRIAMTVMGVISYSLTSGDTSVDRAVTIAQTETNVIGNYDEFTDALESGYTQKEWVTMRDKKVRMNHSDVDGTIIDISEPFMVGDSEMMFPCDDSLGAGAEEIVNCRCVVTFS